MSDSEKPKATPCVECKYADASDFVRSGGRCRAYGDACWKVRQLMLQSGHLECPCFKPKGAA